MSEPTVWQELLHRLAQARPALLDVRAAADYARGHLVGSANRPVGAEAVDADLVAALPGHLLPPRHAPLVVLAASSGEAERVSSWLTARGRDRVSAAAPDWSAAPDGVLETGDSSAVLWKAPPWLTDHADLLPPPSLGPVVDLGSGSGRAAAWLAARGYDVTAVDRHDEALGWAHDLAADLGAAVTTVNADLTKEAEWPRGPWSIAVMLRFLHRPLVKALPDLVKPGGVVVLRTFRWEEGAWTLPRRTFCLEQGELLALFEPHDWNILVMDEGFDEDGRPGAGIVARRR